MVAFGQILPAAVLDAPRLGCFNLHGSLLPRWRGAAPIQRAIMAGDKQTGVQIMRMSEGLDEGPILLGEVMDIHADDTAASLSERMAHTGAALWPRALAAIDVAPILAGDRKRRLYDRRGGFRHGCFRRIRIGNGKLKESAGGNAGAVLDIEAHGLGPGGGGRARDLAGGGTRQPVRQAG